MHASTPKGFRTRIYIYDAEAGRIELRVGLLITELPECSEKKSCKRKMEGNAIVAM
jgi:hypothetical protein